MTQVYQEMKNLYLDYYMETRNQERMIVTGDSEKVGMCIDRKHEIIQKINAFNKINPIEKGDDIKDLISRTLQLEKKNNLVINATMTDLRIKMKTFRNKKNNIMLYSMNK